jgi:hypothetical protein
MIFRAFNLAFFLVIFACPAFAAKALIFSDCVKYDEESGCKEQNLMVYKFTKGVVSKEEYSRFRVSDEYPDLFSDFDEFTKIVQNRYIITGERIYDLKQRKIIHDGYQYEHIRYMEGDTVNYIGRMVGVLGDQVVYVSGMNQDQIYVYDLTRHIYSKADGETERKLQLFTNFEFFLPDSERVFDVAFPKNLGHGFETEGDDQIDHDHPRARKIHYKGQLIGEYWHGDAKTTEGHIALEYASVGENLGYPKGLVIWSADSGQWTEIKIEFLQSFIGWADVE